LNKKSEPKKKLKLMKLKMLY